MGFQAINDIAKIFKKITDQLQGRVERLKNEKASLLREREAIIKKHGTSTYADSKRVHDIDVRLSIIDTILINNAKD
jgi:hypothetical protein